MPTGSCLCGDIKIVYTGNPQYTAVCYCHDDRKINNFQVFQIPKANFAVSQGEPKVYTKKSDHGNDIHNHFCGACGTTLFRTGGEPRMKDNVGLRAGVLDDQSILDIPPKVEVYVERRPPWIKQIEGAIQLNGKYKIVS
ncbi:Mss4-like protein [Talaromyces proteolyticus]|uniref:Mss4-like protein n=1 Tax=Talaromyces proteolyticus TaxID=1131652 RepID=A0AAD4KRE9_9EURO|nr:Mss4-like protein [Talaromyces proteolyticus]KAH8698764.1 Mss4-like protein [Talaromyces proteolyticus]